MDEQQMLDAIGIFTVAVTLVAAVGAQLLKKDAPNGPDGRKRLSQTAILALTVAVIGFGAALATAIIKINMGIEAKAEAKKKASDEAQAKRLETLWKSGVNGLLDRANTTISANLASTLAGFKHAQDLQLQTQNNLLLARQNILEEQLRQGRKIIVAGQPLTSLNLIWRFAGADPVLDRLLRDGRREILDNANDAQGGVSPKPFDYMDYKYNIQPLMYRLAARTIPGEAWRSDPETDHIAVMILLDDANNAVLPFGDTITVPNADDGTRRAQSGASVTDRSYPTVVNVARTYVLSWSLDPAALSASLSKANAAIATPSALPTTLKIAVLFNYKSLPIRTANLADINAAGIWRPFGTGLAAMLPGNAFLAGSRVELIPNGYAANRTIYTFARVYRQDLFDDDGAEADVTCFVIEYVRG